ncbi:MAG TPA: helix-turn-helix domain-containing protein [Nitrosarchaeum sp.]|nr:helix-turn-helix domain-containing protein [Nitrosarchaeum sp.]
MSTIREMTLFDNDTETELYKHKITLERIKNELISFGLTANQSKVFIYLGKYGAKSASEIAKALQMPRTETYQLVNSLQNMGLVTAELAHPTKYSAMEMKQAIETLVKQEQQRINTLAGKEESLSKLWKEVPFFVVETDESKSEKMQLLHGMGPIINKIKEMTKTSTDSIKIYGSIPDVLRLYHSDVFDWIDESSSELQMVISPLSKTPEFISEIDSKKIRAITSDSDKKCFIISDAKEILIFMRNANHTTRQTFAWWSDSETLVDMMSSLFDLSWEKGGSLY